MKLKELYLKNVGPLNRSFDFYDDWSGKIHMGGLVDTEEWTEETIVEKIVEVPNLSIPPRFSLENHII